MFRGVASPFVIKTATVFLAPNARLSTSKATTVALTAFQETSFLAKPSKRIEFLNGNHLYKEINQLHKQAMYRQTRRFSTDVRTSAIIHRLEAVDTAALCDAAKSAGNNELKVMTSNMIPRANVINSTSGNKRMIGIARTVQLAEPEDFLAVLCGLDEAEKGEILCVNTKNSMKAVAGGLFLSEAERKGLNGLVIDGAVRDISSMAGSSIQCYSTSVNPYSGSILHLGEMQVPIICGGVQVLPGDIIFGDTDGIVVANIETLEHVIESAEAIVEKEEHIFLAIKQGNSLHSLTNYAKHVVTLKNGNESTLQFK